MGLIEGDTGSLDYSSCTVQRSLDSNAIRLIQIYIVGISATTVSTRYPSTPAPVGTWRNIVVG